MHPALPMELSLNPLFGAHILLQARLTQPGNIRQVCSAPLDHFIVDALCCVIRARLHGPCHDDGTHVDLFTDAEYLNLLSGPWKEEWRAPER
jgi:hypothetical protein